MFTNKTCSWYLHCNQLKLLHGENARTYESEKIILLIFSAIHRQTVHKVNVLCNNYCEVMDSSHPASKPCHKIWLEMGTFWLGDVLTVNHKMSQISLINVDHRFLSFKLLLTTSEVNDFCLIFFYLFSLFSWEWLINRFKLGSNEVIFTKSKSIDTSLKGR